MSLKTTKSVMPLLTFVIVVTLVGLHNVASRAEAAESDRADATNVVFVLSDDHRYDFMGFMPGAPEFLETPHMDRMAREGAHLANAFVSTSLCSPSRASILTGQYMHHHRVVDNQRPVPKGTVFFPQYLQDAGYTTGFVGKWHMGHDRDDPRPGFHHWVSFRGQGTYFDPVLNVNGERQPREGYTTDVLTDEALKWLRGGRDKTKPFFLYLAFKAVHYPFQPAKRHRGRYQGKPIDYPHTMANTERNYQTQPHWVRERRYSIHGIDHMETGAFDKDPVPDFDDLYYRFCETVHGLDENLGRVLEYLDKEGLSRNTLVIYMGDNGFALGEHGFYDKRDAFELSIRVPMLAYAPGRIAPGTRVMEMVQNIDVAPTILEACGVRPPAAARMDGRSFLPLLKGGSIPWRDHILYEYHWEWNFPATPTTFAIRTDRYKYIFYHGVWDHDGLYDLQTDPHERHNLINVPTYRERAAEMKRQLFDELEASGGLILPVRRPAGERLDQRKLRR
jgi:N-acetylglucosamine-6-sulfatase